MLQSNIKSLKNIDSLIMNEEPTTFLEEFFNTVELLPNDMRRDFELLKELDSNSSESLRELTEAEKTCHRAFKKKKQDGEALDMTLSTDSTKNFEKDSANKDKDYIDLKNARQRIRQRQNEKVDVAINMLTTVDKFVKKIEQDLVMFENELRGTGGFDRSGAEPGQEVCIKPEIYENDWILGRVIYFHNDTGYYDIADVDDSKRYHLPETQVLVLDLADSSRKLSKGEEVLAIYPDTTSFYPATVSAAPRRNAMSSEPSITVQFQGDSDESGITPNRIVLLKHVVRVPM